MRLATKSGLVWLGLSVVVLGCAPQGPGAGQSRAGEASAPAAPAAPKRIVTAMMGNPPLIYQRIVGGGSGVTGVPCETTVAKTAAGHVLVVPGGPALKPVVARLYMPAAPPWTTKE